MNASWKPVGIAISAITVAGALAYHAASRAPSPTGPSLSNADTSKPNESAADSFAKPGDWTVRTEVDELTGGESRFVYNRAVGADGSLLADTKLRCASIKKYDGSVGIGENPASREIVDRPALSAVVAVFNADGSGVALKRKATPSGHLSTSVDFAFAQGGIAHERSLPLDDYTNVVAFTVVQNAGPDRYSFYDGSYEEDSFVIGDELGLRVTGEDGRSIVIKVPVNRPIVDRFVQETCAPKGTAGSAAKIHSTHEDMASRFGNTVVVKYPNGQEFRRIFYEPDGSAAVRWASGDVVKGSWKLLGSKLCLTQVEPAMRAGERATACNAFGGRKVIGDTWVGESSAAMSENYLLEAGRPIKSPGHAASNAHGARGYTDDDMSSRFGNTVVTTGADGQEIGRTYYDADGSVTYVAASGSSVKANWNLESDQLCITAVDKSAKRCAQFHGPKNVGDVWKSTSGREVSYTLQRGRP